jgi:hypothetical protein
MYPYKAISPPTENVRATSACERALIAVAQGWRARLFPGLYGLSVLEMFLLAQHIRDVSGAEAFIEWYADGGLGYYPAGSVQSL